jgi:hypothetical protein
VIDEISGEAGSQAITAAFDAEANLQIVDDSLAKTAKSPQARNASRRIRLNTGEPVANTGLRE